jgi:hypothetical protein
MTALLFFSWLTINVLTLKNMMMIDEFDRINTPAAAAASWTDRPLHTAVPNPSIRTNQPFFGWFDDHFVRPP